jgi:hypothetical protein
MEGNGHVRTAASDDGVLRWSDRIVSAEALARSLDGQRELLVPTRAIITPLAAEQLRAKGVKITRQTIESQPAAAARWGYAQDKLHPVVQSAVQTLARDGLPLKELPPPQKDTPWSWARAVAQCVARGECQGGVLFCQDAALVCCVANKVAGLRAAAATTVPQADRAVRTLGANLVAVEMPGRTFFEIRQILRTLCSTAESACPPDVACVLQELDGHAHR